MRAVRVPSRYFNDRQPSGIIDCGMSLLLWGGLMHGIKIPQQDFALQMQGGGGRVCVTLWYINRYLYFDGVPLWLKASLIRRVSR